MKKLLVFDLDGTLAELGKGISPENIEILKELEEQENQIAICSGKPVYYLCGFMRQAGLNNPILVGENGAVIQFGVDLPPEQYYVLSHTKDAKDSIRFLKEEIDKAIPNMWYQPNEVALTPFPKNKEEFGTIEKIIEINQKRLKDVNIYRHVDSFDITPTGIDKKAGLQYLGKLLNIAAEDTIAIGDGINDYPMFEYAGCSVGIRIKETEKVNKNFQTLKEALEWLRGLA